MLLRTAAPVAVLALFFASPAFAQAPDDLPPAKARGNVQKVDAPVRVKQTLVPGATFEARIKGTLTFDGVDERMGPLLQTKGKIRINYAFEAIVERTIVENDGVRIVEDRNFKLVRCAEVGSTAQSFELKPGPAGQILLDVLSAIPVGGSAKLLIPLIKAIASRGGTAPQIIHLQDKGFNFAGVGRVDSLTGKSVRLTYVDGQGVIDLQPLKGEITDEERDFHLNSIIVSDCLIFPDVNIPVGGKYKVPGDNFGGVVDPSLLAHLGGEVAVRRRADLVRDVPVADGTKPRTCVVLEAYDGKLDFKTGNKEGVQQFGAFNPTGILYYDPAQNLVVEARLTGSGEFTRIPPRHLLRDVKQFGTPQIEMVYSCRRIDRD